MVLVLSRHQAELALHRVVTGAVKDKTDLFKSVSRGPSETSSSALPQPAAQGEESKPGKKAWIQKAEKVAQKMGGKMRDLSKEYYRIRGQDDGPDSDLDQGIPMSSGSGSITIPSSENLMSAEESIVILGKLAEADDIKFFPLEMSMSERPIPKIKAATADRLVEWLTSAKFSGTLSPWPFNRSYIALQIGDSLKHSS